MAVNGLNHHYGTVKISALASHDTAIVLNQQATDIFKERIRGFGFSVLGTVTSLKGQILCKY